ncbi:MAG: DUF11 domain-containing protein [Candidatus Peribacteria bacterium]|nr:DUF11 domain-containing protein [Candidatus Peribacteria bacterium]
MEKYVSIINVEGGIVDYSDIANGKITIHVEEILEGRTKQISFGVGTIPSGIKEGSDITLQALVVGVDDLCGKFSATANITTTIIANPTLGYKSLYVYKTSKASYLLSKDAVEYQMMVQNVGSLTTSEVYVVDILPAKSSFIEAYTTATTPADTYQCVGCEVYFSKANANLPKKFDPLQPFTTAMIKSYFTKGTENAGVRTSPYGEETKYVAYLVDDTTKNPSLLPVGGGGEKKVGIKIQDKGSKIGSLLTNGVAVFSKDLMQSIGNPKGVTVLEYPGLMTRMESDKDIVNACESFERNIGYNHDGTAENHSTTLTVRLPNTVKLATGSDAISHSWSNKTALEGGLSTNYQAIRNNNNLTI